MGELVRNGRLLRNKPHFPFAKKVAPGHNSCMTNQPVPSVPTTIETERLLIRCPRPGDGKALFDAIMVSREHLSAWLTWASWPNISLKRAEASVLRNRDRYLKGKDMTMFIFLKESNALIGGSGLHDPDWQVPKFEIGYWQHVDYGGQGYMTEAVNAIASLAFQQLGAKRLQLECYPHNERSIRVAQRCGFQLEARLSNYRRHHHTNVLHDWLIFVRLPSS
ncbi:GNAT family N-acetyltransferase [Candidatus Leptofilum sp.]|uniref:GNAT family N-acetyltransferase n=1 Tax=Candidatus Leptofilum sp. TaxID=3241576 RepID=UPI003B5C5B5B